MRPTPRITVPLILSASLLAASCSSTAGVVEASDTTATPTTKAPTTTVESTTTTAEPTTTEAPTTTTMDLSFLEPAAEATLELVSTGAEPRHLLTYAFEDGATAVMSMSQTQELGQVLNEVPIPSMGPITSNTEMLTEITRIEDGYLINQVVSEVSLGDDVPEQIAPTLLETLQTTVGLRLVSVMDYSGRTLSVGIDESTTGAMPSAILDPLRDTMESFNNPFPTEPVGVGASWTVTTVVHASGLDLNQVTTYTVTDVGPEWVNLDSSVTQTAPEGSVMSSQGIDFVVTAWSVSGSASIEIDLSSPVPSSTITTDADQGFTFVEQGTESTLTQTSAMTVVVGPR